MEKNKIRTLADFTDIMKYIRGNLYQDRELLSLPHIAGVFGFRPRYFSEKFIEYFGINYADFVAKARIRRAAQDIYDMGGTRNAVKRYDPWIKNFSLSFRKEFGLSPRSFLKTNPTLPDLPLIPTINGKEVTMHYESTGTVEITGSAYLARRADVDLDAEKSFLMSNVSYPFRKPQGRNEELNDPGPNWGIWWYDYRDADKLYYVFGKEDQRQEYKGREGFVEPDRIHTSIKGGDYAVFSVGKGKDYFETAQNARDLAWYVFHVWVPFNMKILNRMGYTYEMFDQDHVWLYLPLVRGMGGINIRKKEHVDIDDLAGYINEHVLEGLTVNQVVNWSGRSGPNVRNQFMSCYKISISDYILGRKCLILREMLDRGELTEQELADRYQYASPADLERDYQKVRPRLEVAMEMPDFNDFYDKNRHNLKVEYESIEAFDVAGKCIIAGDMMDEDLPGVTAYWMEHEPEELKDTVFAGRDDRISLSSTDLIDERKSHTAINHYVGPQILEGEELPDGLTRLHVAGGKYISFSLKKMEGEELAEVHRALYLMVHQVWTRRNRILLDIVDRIVFFRYKEGVLSCYVPVF